jgi:hypothetical protein
MARLVDEVVEVTAARRVTRDVAGIQAAAVPRLPTKRLNKRRKDNMLVTVNKCDGCKFP